MNTLRVRKPGLLLLLVALLALDGGSSDVDAAMPAANRSAAVGNTYGLDDPTSVSAHDERDPQARLGGNRRLQVQGAGRRVKNQDDDGEDLSVTQGWLKRLLLVGDWIRNATWSHIGPAFLGCLLLFGLTLASKSVRAQDSDQQRIYTQAPVVSGDLTQPSLELAPVVGMPSCEECAEEGSGEEDVSGIIGKMLILLRGGNIELTPIDEYPRIPFLDCDDPNSFFYTWRANIVGQEISEEWDFYNLVSTDRRDFTDATFSAGAGVVIFETGHTYSKVHTPQTRIGLQQVPEMTIRSGITNEFELRFKWLGIAMIDQLDVASGARLKDFGAQDINQIGFKYEVAQQDGWRPMVTVLGTVGPPSGAPHFSGHTTAVGFNNVLGWGLRRWLYLKVSQGVDVYGKPSFEYDNSVGPVPFRVAVDNVSEWHQSVSLLSQLSKHIGMFHEWYCLYRGDAADNRPDHFIDTGLFIYVTPNVQLDVRAGTRLSDRISEQFYGSGFSLRY